MKWNCVFAIATAAVAFSAFTAIGNELRWTLKEQIDDITAKKVRVVGLAGEDGKSVLVLRAEEGKRPALSVVPAMSIFPDTTDIESKAMGVEITLRSTAMESPRSGTWRMAWMNYKSAATSLSKDEALTKVFAGDSITLQFDKTGRRFKFRTSGAECEGLKEAVAKALELAPDEDASPEAQRRPPADDDAATRPQPVGERMIPRKSVAARLDEHSKAEAKLKAEAKAQEAGNEAGQAQAAKLGKNARMLRDTEIARRARKSATEAGYTDERLIEKFCEGFADAIAAAAK